MAIAETHQYHPCLRTTWPVLILPSLQRWSHDVDECIAVTSLHKTGDNNEAGAHWHRGGCSMSDGGCGGPNGAQHDPSS